MVTADSALLLDRLLAERPSFHQSSDGQPASWAARRGTLEFIAEHVRQGMRTLETGAGYTTVIFAAAGAHHTCVTPERAEAERILDYPARAGVAADIRFVLESSDRALAREGVVPPELDFVFIDGAHRFPLPCIDWHYCEGSLKVGGIVGIDDFEMPSVGILHHFLRFEEEWQLVAVRAGTSFFRRVKATELLHDWQGQKINQRLWRTVSAKHPIRRLVSRTISTVRRFIGRIWS